MIVVTLDGFRWQVQHASVFGVPLPSGLFHAVSARSFALNGMYQFDVRAVLPLAGLVVAYRGSLAPTRLR